MQPQTTAIAVDDLGRPVVSDEQRQRISDALRGLKGRGAIVVIADDNGTRGHLAANLGKGWKVAGGGGWKWHEQKPSGFVGVEWDF